MNTRGLILMLAAVVVPALATSPPQHSTYRAAAPNPYAPVRRQHADPAWVFRPIFPLRHHAPAPATYRVQQYSAVNARMDILPGNSDKIGGALFFSQISPSHPVYVTGTLTGLSPGKHGLHVHGTPNLGNKCSDAGGHFNPLKAPHGAQTNSIETRHVGDLGNIVANGHGVARVDIQDHIISLFPGDRNVIRRAMVVHSGEDDLGLGGDEGSLKTGNAGSRLGCGIIAPNNPQY